jgi:DNA-binding LytR/AlgR family response regulator
LAKPVDIELLRANLQKVAYALPFGEEPALVLKQKGVLLPVPLREIYYIQSKNHTVSVHMAGETITAYEKLENLLHSLSGGFFQCHKSYIVNMSQIRRFEANDILLKNGETIPASRARYAQTRAAYLKFMGQKI